MPYTVYVFVPIIIVTRYKIHTFHPMPDNLAKHVLHADIDWIHDVQDIMHG